ncbi:3-deoxy-D-manno-octulosonic acid transferase [Hydrogenovibrio sp. 3SP14C1]|uniref:3-deoxy-D-manno-octulosonic acid transferase n=1 Tax=Hydrogenovibrio sp. 3SP14C1 TaxID=3038774 RepID=UPI002415DAB3|nr:3-deoxy-D-manno-octulosonic acid transferase [Hydrogenovibrio sp. 3SP14C1]MDG4811738.1 3-deoxy-D-manno-octulosonic acid transferase [Hydrogenovibrio sp. 3SP14C1]
MSLWLYRFLLILAFPAIAYSGWKRCHRAKKQAKKDSDYAPIPHCFAARFGWSRQPFQQGGIWVHAVSVGETRSIFPLLTELKKAYPDLPITVTNGSTQGAQQALRFAPVPIQHQMIPYDYPSAVQRFLKKLQPRLVIMVETEIWPNLYQACWDQQIPLILANARIKEKSFYAYQKWGGKLIANALNQTRLIASQFALDTEHMQALGAHPARVKQLGNLKFDIDVPTNLTTEMQQWRQTYGLENKFIWVAASTHEKEEALMLQAHQQLLQHQPNALLILVPRHTDRFIEVAQLLSEKNIPFVSRSKDDLIQADTQVYLADTIGELMKWFAASDAAFIGGSLVPFGGHNILEPAALKKPVLSGQYHKNLQALYDSFKQDDAILISKDENELAQQLIQLAESPEWRMQKAEDAYACFKKQAGALPKLMHEIGQLLPPTE